MYKHAIILLIPVLAWACTVEKDEVVTEQLDVIALLNGEAIDREEFEKFLSLQSDNDEDILAGPGRTMLFREFLIRRLLFEEAREANVLLELDEAQIYVQEWLPDEEQQTPELVEHARVFLTIQRFVREKFASQLTVGLSEMQKYYERYADEFIVEDQANVLEILVDDVKLAGRIRQGIRSGDVRTFKEMARRHSTGLTSRSGGDLGIFSRRQLPEDFEKVIFKLKPGEISAPFQSAQGYHLFMMEEWIPRHAQKFYEVQEIIFQRLLVEKERDVLERYVQELFETASIEIFDQSLNAVEEMPNEDL